MNKTLLFLLLFSLPPLAAQDVFDHARSGDLEALKTLINAEPDLAHSTNEQGYSPLILACYYDQTEVVSYLLDSCQVDINAGSGMGTALMAAAVKRNTDLGLLLLSHDADPNLTDANGTTALHYATMFQLEELIAALVAAAADPNIKDKTGKSPMDYAVMHNNQNILNLFKTQ